MFADCGVHNLVKQVIEVSSASVINMLRDTTQQFSHMDKLALVKHLLWKATNISRMIKEFPKL